ncbi:hypothetical protein EIP86_004605 [Pleurotus ostreatoroseus]|nr:hypothetical protein EIP86_004605 [Pleurotus ostreatoroseus]
MLSMCHAASVPKMRDLAGRQGLPMTRRAGVAAGSPTSLSNVDNVAYTVDVTIGGQSFPVQLDTGSSDLWVSGANTSNIETNDQPDNPLFVEMDYGSGSASGNVFVATLEVGGLAVRNQAFVIATDVEHEPFDEFQGIMGVGFNAESKINTAFQQAFGDEDTTGSSSISNILSQNNVLGSFDIQLNRLFDDAGESTGTLFIGSHDDSFSDITQQPQLSQVSPDAWSIALDAMKVNGNAFKFNQSSVSGVPSGKIATEMDSGTSLALLPPAAIDFIYSSMPGSVFVGNESEATFQWLVPCNGTTNVTFTYGGVDFPVHYLDLIQTDTAILPIQGQNTNVTICYNAYQYLTLDPTEFSGFDALMGDAFLRNAYASFNFGVTPSGSAPFIQMIPTTGFDTAFSDFQTSMAKTLASLPKALPPADIVKSAGQQVADAQSSGAVPSSSATQSSSSSTSTSSSSSSPSPSHHNSSRSLRSDGLVSLFKSFIPVVFCIFAGAALIN